MSGLAERYEKRYPDTGISEAQKEERMERLVFKEEGRSPRRSKRARGMIVPELPWIVKGCGR